MRSFEVNSVILFSENKYDDDDDLDWTNFMIVNWPVTVCIVAFTTEPPQYRWQAVELLYTLGTIEWFMQLANCSVHTMDP